MTVETSAAKRLDRIRSFVLRQGRITQAQEWALHELWPSYGLEYGKRVQQTQVFGRQAPLVCEIGFGNGESLAEMAADAPDWDFIGIEVHKPGVGRLLLQIHERQLRNIRVLCADAVEVLDNQITDGSLDRIQIFFPDPWHKKRHHKRRLINDSFARLAMRKLKPGGVLHCATDWENYARHMLEVFERCPGLRNVAGEKRFVERPSYRPLTKFESRGHRLGHGVWDLLFERNELNADDNQKPTPRS